MIFVVCEPPQPEIIPLKQCLSGIFLYLVCAPSSKITAFIAAFECCLGRVVLSQVEPCPSFWPPLMMCIDESRRTRVQNRSSLDPTPGAPPAFSVGTPRISYVIPIPTNKPRFGEMQLMELVSGETVTVGYGYRTDQYLLHYTPFT